MSILHHRMFIAIPTLEAWMDSENVEMTERTMTLRKLGCTSELEPAVRFLSIVSETLPPQRLGKSPRRQRRVGARGASSRG